MSHIVGTIQVLATPLTIGAGTTLFNPPASPAPGGTKFLLLHFQNLNLQPGDELQVNLGYDIDRFTAADGPSFWTRPVNVYAFPAGVQITYVDAGAGTGNVQLDQYGRGERHAGEAGHPSFSNCDPFYQGSSYEEPTYDPFWYCANPPNWENAACATPLTDVRARVARSVGMILSVETSDYTSILQLSTCSVTLVDADKVMTAGHCHTPAEALNSSVTFDYLTQCDGSRPPGYNPRFYKVKAVLAHRYDSTGDFSLLQLAEAPAGIPVIQMRPDLPGVGEQIFGVHHPNGAVKKLSLPHGEGFATVVNSASSAINVPTTFHVSGGSSGSGLFDAAGRIVGILSNGNPCGGGLLTYFPIATTLQIIAPAPPPVTRDVMLVFDRSGSMSLDDGTGRPKIDSARDALSLFVQLVKSNAGNRLGLVSFSTSVSSPVDFAISDVTPGSKNTLIGPPPYVSGKLLGLTPGGMTTIGGGLAAAQAQLAGAGGANPKAILLMTDGLQNTPPMIADVEGSLAGTTVHAIGFGSESNLDGALLQALAGSHGGLYTRASGGLSLEKFFSNAFGNIFEYGILMDPEFDLPANQRVGTAVPFRICGEEAITVVAGWDNTDAALYAEVTTPGGALITIATPTVETASGRTWTFLRVPLPVGGERDGLWTVNVARPGGGGEFPPPAPALRYFINIIPSGGPQMRRFREGRRYYTGDTINPMVLVRYDDGGWPDGMKASMTISYPDTSVGNVLSKAGLAPAGTTDADGIPPRQATLQSIEQSSGKPVVTYVDTTIDLYNDSLSTGGAFEATATFGKPLVDFLKAEGNYTFHAKATYGDDCTGMRELTWSIHVDVGIDSGSTSATTTELPSGPGGGSCFRMVFTPRDKYGNLLGPGRADGFTLEPQPGSTPSGAVSDLGNGSYQVDLCTEPGSLEPPRIGIVQPGRPPVVVTSSNFRVFVYGVKFICGEHSGDCCGCAPLRPGRYSTEINIHNWQGKDASVLKRVIPLVFAGAATGRAPKVSAPTAHDTLRLPAHHATMVDCCWLAELLLGARPETSIPLTMGILEIVSTIELSVSAVYTATDASGSAPSISVQQVEARVLVI
ncbi:VWA domain-containing protein [Ralstonia syzygii]|uniref:VWA domain-containing protein n=1 Tax=Ralstonia syzygii TaxID=28097 RepID=A0ABX7ZDZ1_9RALS|nr:vWA domain-containing protein [Ralstonia syzygii]QUP53621.1 VWA domain-containing protein [Ralstonia syzygii]